jgi:4'-phosphopantetheinyl transferase
MTLEPGIVEIWRADLDLAGDQVEELLTPSEREPAGRFRSEAARERWTRARGTLRQLLGRYLDRDPATVELSFGPNGKPALAGQGSLEFNLSHSGTTGLFAFTLDNPVGVDVELRDRKVRDALGAATRVLGEREAERLRKLPEDERDLEFLRSWVRHEAALKCVGEGLGTAVDPAGLFVREIDVGPDAMAAVALVREPREVRVRRLEPVRDGAG